jgi:SNF2 family DNA or RNA helicase
MFKPMKHQTATLKLMDKTPIIFDMSDPGTGKTYVEIMAFAKRRKKGCGAMLVLAPKSLLRSAWEDDIRKFAPHLTTSVATAENRAKAFEADVDVYITNIDATTWLATQKPVFFKRFGMLVVDEVDSFKHHTSGRSKALNKITKHFEFRSIMSGTPNTNTILDIWNPVQVLDGGARLGKQFYGFRGAVCTPEQVGPRPEMVKWVDKEGSEEAIYGLIADISIRHKFDDCIDIPETHSYTMTYHLTSKQKKAYMEMEATQIMTLKNGKGMVTAINASAVYTKLMQIASGAVYENDETYHLVDTGRYEMIMDLVDDRKHPLVFFLWKHQRDELVKQAEKRGLTYCVMDGEATQKERDAMVQAYQNGFYKVMFAHPKSAAHGLTLTRGTSIIWASPTYDLGFFTQGNRRQARNGQKEKTEIIVVLAEGTIEEKVYRRLMEKDVKMSNLLDLFAEAA